MRTPPPHPRRRKGLVYGCDLYWRTVFRLAPTSRENKEVRERRSGLHLPSVTMTPRALRGWNLLNQKSSAEGRQESVFQKSSPSNSDVRPNLRTYDLIQFFSLPEWGRGKKEIKQSSKTVLWQAPNLTVNLRPESYTILWSVASLWRNQGRQASLCGLAKGL